MEEEKKKKENRFEVIAVGKQFIELIEIVTEKFIKEYGFTPDKLDITNLIARRVMENNLF